MRRLPDGLLPPAASREAPPGNIVAYNPSTEEMWVNGCRYHWDNYSAAMEARHCLNKNEMYFAPQHWVSMTPDRYRSHLDRLEKRHNQNFIQNTLDDVKQHFRNKRLAQEREQKYYQRQRRRCVAIADNTDPPFSDRWSSVYNDCMDRVRPYVR